MAEINRERLAEVMAEAAAGELLAPLWLYQEFGQPVMRALRSHLSALGQTVVNPDDLHGLTMDACMFLADHASAWRPDGGALPWVWAERQLRKLASDFVGQWTDELDETLHDLSGREPAGGDEPEELELLQQIAHNKPTAGLLAEALTAITSERNQRILLAYRMQASLGDPSPAHTTGQRFGMTPPAVRQCVKRTRDRLRHLIDAEPRYADLVGLPLAG